MHKFRYLHATAGTEVVHRHGLFVSISQGPADWVYPAHAGIALGHQGESPNPIANRLGRPDGGFDS